MWYSAAAAAAGTPVGDVQVLLALAKALDPTGKALPKWRANNTKNWCRDWLADNGCNPTDGRLYALDISQAGLRAAGPLKGTLPQQLPLLPSPLDLLKLQISGPGITGKLPAWVLQVAYTVEVTNTSIMGPLPSLPAAAQSGAVAATAQSVQITGNLKLSDTLPASWGTALQLYTVNLSNNALAGTIPDAWSTSSTLQEINLSGNKLSGSISRAWARSASSSSLRLLNISGNVGMKGCLADAKGRPWESLPFIDASRTPLLDCLKLQPASQTSWLPASCDVAGYTLKARQLPKELEKQPGSDQRVLLYTLQPPTNNSAAAATPYPLATLAEAAAACDALDACVMFTSDGYLVGAARLVDDDSALREQLEMEKRLGPWQWQTMRYCSGKCCGTWVSAGFDAASLAVAAVESRVQVGNHARYVAAQPPGSQALVPPPGAGTESDDFNLYESVRPSSKRCSALRANDVSSFTCPPRCRVACCAKEDAQDGSTVRMSNQHFRQCSAQACSRSCRFQDEAIETVAAPPAPSGQPTVAPVSAPHQERVVALYLAQKKKTRANGVGAPGKSPVPRKSGGSGRCAGSLC
uniref:Leucine-rich repeat-containing N-terminal plant-type domain-containing protein n=1 Tax=Tetradesmus obliquus TaxID=3088 RepID=A0A383WGC8_TETOB|eukprot:jgi/Sobl393_1/10039/SZX76460.1